MRYLVIDGQGGRMGALLVKKLKEVYPGEEVVAIGTNSLATSAMLKAGADAGATGENPVVRNAPEAEVILGPVGILVTDAILGEVTEKMAVAVGRSRARKILLPVAACSVTVAGTANAPLAVLVDEAVRQAGREPL